MNFFEAQDRARNRTWLLLALFAIALLSFICLSYLAALFIEIGMRAYHEETLPEGSIAEVLTDYHSTDKLLIVATAVSAIVALGTISRIIQLRGGGYAIVDALGGKLIVPAAATGKQRQLVNIVEEMALASGIPMPQLYVLPDRSINAFAAGTKINDSIIGVTEGAVEALDRDQMQGVIAHEFSHIFNGDTRINIRLIGVISGITIISLFGGHLMHMGFLFAVGSRSDWDRRHSGHPIGLVIVAAGAIICVVGAIGLLFGNLIRAAISRQREFLADASAVQFTRNPDGIAGALKKIGEKSGIIKNRHAPEYSHMYFASGVSLNLTNMLASHPPLATRIKRITQGRPLAEKSRPQQPDTGPSTKPRAAAPSVADILVAQIGTINAASLLHARKLRENTPARLNEAAEDPYCARALIYAMLLDRRDERLRDLQFAHLREHADTGVYDLTRRYADDIAKLGHGASLHLVQQLFAALRTLTEFQKRLFMENIAKLIDIDEKLELFEWCIQAAVLHLLFEDPRTAASNLASGADYCLVLSQLATAGNPDTAERCFAAAALEVGPDQSDMNYRRGAIDAQQMFAAAQRLSTLDAGKKQRFAKAAITAVVHDEHIGDEQEQLLRAFFMIIDCSLPVKLEVSRPPAVE